MDTESCFTCLVATRRADTPGGLLVDDGLVVVNHRGSDLDPRGNVRAWPGWFIVSPRRHVTRLFQLTGDEQAAVMRTAAAVDAALTELYGATRSLLASLGWWVDDHVHVHVVPTFADPTLGWLNFGHPGPDLGVPVDEVAAAVASRLTATAGPFEDQVA